MQGQKLLKIVGYTALVIFIYIFTKVLSLSGRSEEVYIAEEITTIRRFSRYGFVFPSTFNRSCTSGYLGLPMTLLKSCATTSVNTSVTQDPSSACVRLTCRSLLRGDDPQLEVGISAELFKKTQSVVKQLENLQPTRYASADAGTHGQLRYKLPVGAQTAECITTM